MKLKSYYGANIKEALTNAQRDLGPEAAIMASRQVRPEEGLPAAFEVVCGVPVDEPAAAPARRAEEKVTRKARGGTLSRLSKPVAAVREALTRSGAPDGFDAESLRAGLLADGFGDDLTGEILAGVRQRQRKLTREDTTTAQQILAAELACRIRVAPELGRSRDTRRVVALVGPPGAGKTTTLVKLAARYGLTGQRPMHVISTDSYRIGGSDMLRTYAAAMATTFETVETANGLAQSLEEHANKGLVLIDTQGLGPADMKSAAQFAAMMSKHTEIDVHLVLPAWMDTENLQAAIGRFRPFLPSKLLITSLDCTASCRKVIAQALLCDKPVSFLGTGQMIPEDLQPATAERLAGLLSGAQRNAVSAA